MSLDLVNLEISRYDWAAMECGCGKSAQHLVADLLAMCEDGQEAQNLSDHLLPAAEVLVEPSLPALRVLLAIIASEPPGADLFTCYWLVQGLVGDNVSPGEDDLVPELRAAAREALWSFYAEILSGRSVRVASTAFEILHLIDGDSDRLESVRLTAGDRLAAYIHAGQYGERDY
ncbi:hypothetical protein [Lentzea sp. E54]|uniref:hypothetical protein n=1 Tax=Lentzea xerophila TaxID=3435883 RepID=UPI003DA5D73F